LLPLQLLKYAKMTLPNPELFHIRYNTGHAYPQDVYANDYEYFADIALAYRTELQILYDAGCRDVTIDDPNLACKLMLTFDISEATSCYRLNGWTFAPRR
jgi:methionine synthase II (cobalamin-independent)